jgi:hypothetical protein
LERVFKEQQCTYFKIAVVYTLQIGISVRNNAAESGHGKDRHGWSICGIYMAQSSVIARSEDIVCLTTWQVLLHCENA